MKNYNPPSSESDQANLGCVIIIGLVLLPYILHELLVALIPYLLLGVIGLVIYRIYIYDLQTGNVTHFIETKFNIAKERMKKTQSSIEPENKDVLALIRDEMDSIKIGVKTIIKEEVGGAIMGVTEEIDLNNKNSIVNEVFGNKKIEYKRSDEYEEQKLSKSRQKREEELSKKEFEFEIRENLMDVKFEMKENKLEAKESLINVREELKGDVFHLRETVTSLTGYVTEKFAYVDARITTEISSVKDTIGNLRIEVKEQYADLRISIGKEVVRIDKVMLQVINKLESYNNNVERCNNKLEGFRNELKKEMVNIERQNVNNERHNVRTERQNIRTERMLTQAQGIYSTHQAELKVMSKDMDLALSKIALGNESFSNTVGAAKLKLDKVSQDQYLTLKEISVAQKDLAHGKIGISALRQQYQQESALGEQKAQSLLQEKRRIEERIQERISRNEQVGDLRHKLYMTKEDLRHSAQQSSLQRQEFAMINRLTK